jgi:hypothetical protein
MPEEINSGFVSKKEGIKKWLLRRDLNPQPNG